MFHPRSHIRVFISIALGLFQIPSATFARQNFDDGFDPNDPIFQRQLQAQAQALGLLGPHGAAGGVGGAGYGRPLDNGNFGITYQPRLRIQNFCFQNNIQNMCTAIDNEVTKLNGISAAADFEKPFQSFVKVLQDRGIKLPSDRKELMNGLCIKPAFATGSNGSDPAGATEADVVEAPPVASMTDDVISAVRRVSLEKWEQGWAAIRGLLAASDVSPIRIDRLKSQVQGGAQDAVPPTPPRRPNPNEATDVDCDQIPIQGNPNPLINPPIDTENKNNFDRPSGDSQGGNNESGSPQGGGGGGGGYQKNSKKLEEVKMGEPKNVSPFAPPGPVNEACMFCQKIEEAGRSRARYDNSAVSQIEKDAALFSENIQKGIVPVSMPQRNPVSLPTTRDALNSLKGSGRSNIFGPAMNATSKK